MGVPFFAGGYLNLQIEGEAKRAIIKKITHTINKSWISDIEFF
jgi:putative phage tail protein D